VQFKPHHRTTSQNTDHETGVSSTSYIETLSARPYGDMCPSRLSISEHALRQRVINAHAKWESLSDRISGAARYYRQCISCLITSLMGWSFLFRSNTRSGHSHQVTPRNCCFVGPASRDATPLHSHQVSTPHKRRRTNFHIWLSACYTKSRLIFPAREYPRFDCLSDTHIVLGCYV